MTAYPDVFIVGAARTPIGKFLGGLAPLKASDLGAIAIKAAMERAGVSGGQVDELLMGHVVQGGQGQAPARQAARKAGLPDGVSRFFARTQITSPGMRVSMARGTRRRPAHMSEAIASHTSSPRSCPPSCRVTKAAP